jgi:hypothetical protein
MNALFCIQNHSREVYSLLEILVGKAAQIDEEACRRIVPGISASKCPAVVQNGI